MKMGFNKRILPNKITLQNMVYDFGVESVVKKYINADVLFGDAESKTYFETIVREYELGK